MTNTFTQKIPSIMGIINITSNSYCSIGRSSILKEIIKRIEEMISNKVDIIDIGACATNPYTNIISYENEKKYLKPILKYIYNNFSTKIIFSIDTFRWQIAQMAIDSGFTIINDVSGGNMNKKIFENIKNSNIQFVLMYIKDSIYNVHKHSILYKKNYILNDINIYFNNKILMLKNCGLNKIIIDPGIGFTKNYIFDFEIISNLNFFQKFNLPIMVGISRKSMINKILQYKPYQNTLNASTIMHMISLFKGASILRVHDFKEAMECKNIFLKMLQFKL
ncbi:MAG: dihydropteroate synthase [Bacteroides sp.]|nr:MAG: dihydropteroate synthase [Bacteroides sp.]